MNARFLLLAATPAAIVSPAAATTYLSAPQAQALLFPHATLSPDFRTLTPDQAKAIHAKSGVNLLTRQVKLWRASTGGSLIIDEVVGKHEFITFALELDAGGAVRGLEIMDYKETYGGEVRNPVWRGQFNGKHDGAPLVVGKDIRNNSGGTLSARHVTDGVKRLLATYAVVYGHKG